MAEYNGHRSWNAWNVSLWIGNDEGLYRMCKKYVDKYGIERAARFVYRDIGETKTPDGATFNRTSIREALRGL